MNFGGNKRYSILFYSILFYSILLYSIRFYFILFYSILFNSILFYSILFYSILFYICGHDLNAKPSKCQTKPVFRYPLLFSFSLCNFLLFHLFLPFCSFRPYTKVFLFQKWTIKVLFFEGVTWHTVLHVHVVFNHS